MTASATEDPRMIATRSRKADGASDLRLWVEQLTGGTVSHWQRTSRGGSRETFLVDVTMNDGGVSPLVLRAEAGGSFTGTEINVAKEASVYRALAGTAVPVPQVVGVALVTH